MKLEDNIKMDPREIGYKDGGWTELAWNQVQWWILIFGINRCWTFGFYYQRISYSKFLHKI